MNEDNLRLDHMASDDIDAAVELIGLAMNFDEALYARTTLEFHFALGAHGVNDGRSYFSYRKGGRLIALVGLHSYLWGPPENVWLAWFAIDPAHQRKGLGGRLIKEAEEMARDAGYEKFFVETYDSADFEKARAFYEKSGFTRAGRIEDYMPDGSAMIVYRKTLTNADCPPW